VKCIDAEPVLFIRARIINETDGMQGVRDAGLLKSAVMRRRSAGGG